jgi:hypothetical protein
MNQLFRIFAIAPLLLLSQALFAQDLDRHTVLDNLIAAYGGEENVRRLDNVVQEWDMVAIMSKRHGKDVRHVRMPDQLMVKLTYPDRVEKRILHGEDGQVIFRDLEPAAATPAQRDAMRLQIMRLYSPLVLRDKADAVSLRVEGDLCALTLMEHGLQVDYLVNMDTWRIEKVVGTVTINGTQMRFLTEYSDFDFVDGILVHQKENKYAGNVNTAMLQLRKITFGAGLDEDSFTVE